SESPACNHLALPNYHAPRKRLNQGRRTPTAKPHRRWCEGQTCHNVRVGPEFVIARLKALRDPRMRVLALIEALSAGEADAWVEALAALVVRSHRVDDADAIEAVQTITHAAADPSLPYETRQRLYEV